MSDSHPLPRLLTGRAAAVAVGAVSLVLLTGAVVATSSTPASAPVAAPSPSQELTLSSDVVSTDPGIEIGAAPSSAGAAPEARAAAAPIAVRYTFDSGAGHRVMDVTGRFAMQPRTATGGSLGFTRHGSGWAAVFPSRCTALPRNCPRTILEGGDPNALNPGTRRLQYGASVLMRPTDTADGANVIQKGFSVGGSTQYKMQVDGVAGRPSCVIASASRIYRVIAPVRVADGRWHSVSCTRLGPVLSITVDGVRRGAARLPGRLSIVNAEPLRIGGKSITVNNDQYAGQIDDVYITIN